MTLYTLEFTDQNLWGADTFTNISFAINFNLKGVRVFLNLYHFMILTLLDPG